MSIMPKFTGTLARVGKAGVWDHNHDGYGWHWACAGHRDNGEIHAAAKASTPKFADGFSASTVSNGVTYAQAFSRQAVTRIPSKAKVASNVTAQAAAAAAK